MRWARHLAHGIDQRHTTSADITSAVQRACLAAASTVTQHTHLFLGVLCVRRACHEAASWLVYYRTLVSLSGSSHPAAPHTLWRPITREILVHIRRLSRRTNSSLVFSLPLHGHHTWISTGFSHQRLRILTLISPAYSVWSSHSSYGSSQLYSSSLRMYHQWAKSSA